MVHTLSLLAQWTISGGITVASLAPIGGINALCPLRRWYAAAVSETLLRPLPDSRIFGAGAASVAATLVHVLDGNNGSLAAPASSGPNTQATDACPAWPAGASTSPSATAAVAASAVPGVNRSLSSAGGVATLRRLQSQSTLSGASADSVAAGCFAGAVPARMLAAGGAGSASRGLLLSFSVVINATRQLSATDVQDALQAQAARAFGSPPLLSLLAALAAAVGMPPPAADDRGDSASFVGSTVCSSDVHTAVIAAEAAATPTRDAGAAAAPGAATRIDAAGIGVGAAAGIVASAFMAAIGATVWKWLQARRRNQRKGPLTSRSAATPSPIGSASNARKVPASAAAGPGLRMHSNPALAMYAGRGIGTGISAQLRSASATDRMLAAGSSPSGTAPTLRTAAGSVQAALRTTAAFRSTAVERNHPSVSSAAGAMQTPFKPALVAAQHDDGALPLPMHSPGSEQQPRNSEVEVGPPSVMTQPLNTSRMEPETGHASLSAAGGSTSTAVPKLRLGRHSSVREFVPTAISNT